MKERFEEARGALGEGPSASRRALQRARLLGTSPPREAPWRWAWMPALAAVALAVGLWWTSTSDQVRLGDTVEALLEPSVLRFAKGTTVTVTTGSSVRVERLDESQVDVVVMNGRIAAEVTKGTGRVWRYHAGPWVVKVVGTKLGVAWNEPSQVVEVDVSEGVVEVSRDGEAPVLVRAGEALRRGQASEAKVPTPEEGPQVIVPRPPAPAPVVKSRVVPRFDAGVVAPRREGWRRLLEQGHRALAVERAEEDNVMGDVNELTDDDALLLADAARLERHQSLAYQLLTVVSQRGGGPSAEALFLLGRMQVDGHELAGARTSLSASLRLAPDGPFSEQARGRLLELLMELGDADAASSVAADYLERSPNGPWAGLARRVRSHP